MTTIADSLQAAADAVNGNAQTYLGVATGLNNEIGAVATNAGLDPTQNVGTRFTRAVRSGQLVYMGDQSTTPGLITVTPILAHSAYVAGMPLTVKLNQDITGATTINLSGLGTRPVRYLGSGELQKYDFLKGDTIELLCDAAGANFLVATPPSRSVIDTAVTKTVHGAGADFPDLIAAMAWINRRRIAATGSVTFQVAVGVNANKFVYTSNLNLAHPDGARLSIVGAPLQGSLPAGSSLSFTGNGAAARATDTGVNTTLLRNFYQTELYFQGAAVRGLGQIGNVANILFTTDGTAGDLIAWQSGFVTWTNNAVIGAGGQGINTGSASFVLAGTNYVLGCASNGFGIGTAGNAVVAYPGTLVTMSNAGQGLASYAGLVAGVGAAGAGLYSRGNGLEGVAIVGGRLAATPGSVSRDNGGSGWTASSGRMEVNNTISSGNTNHGYQAQGTAFVDAQNTTGSGNGGYGYLAQDGGNLRRTGGAATGTTAAASPTVGSNGNNNALIS